MLWWTVIGTVASVIGLGVGIYVIVVARGAREAAQAASALGRKRNLAEELESASQKIQQVGNFIQQGQWVPVRMRTEEILVSCKIALSRWPDNLSESHKNGILTAARLMRSITLALGNCKESEMTEVEKKKIREAQIGASGHISSALGEARKEQERYSEDTNGN
jgi:hypothetical protein